MSLCQYNEHRLFGGIARQWLVLFLITGPSIAAKASLDAPCPRLLNRAAVSVSLDDTDSFVGYVSYIFDEGFVGTEEITRLVEGLDEHNQVLNPIDQTSVRVSAELAVISEGLQTFIRRGQLDKMAILNWGRSFLREHQRAQNSQEVARADTTELFHTIDLKPIWPQGTFQFGATGEKVTVNLTNAFAMTSTKITQWQWTQVMRESPPTVSSAFSPMTFDIDGRQVTMVPDLPVGRVSWWSTLVFANRLSEQEGLTPVYDLDDIEFTGRAEDGSLQAIHGKLKIRSFRDDVPEEQRIYFTEGYRLPTSAEWEYVASNEGQDLGPHFFGKEQNELQLYAFFDSDDNRLQPVAELRALIVQGQHFYDLYGNGQEWVHDRVHHGLYGFRQGGENPAGTVTQAGPRVEPGSLARCFSALNNIQRSLRGLPPLSSLDINNPINFCRVVRGVPPYRSSLSLNPGFRDARSSNVAHDNSISFRLVRTTR